MNCGSCDSGETCSNNECVCVPDCSGKECGDDGCGGSCGSCDSELFCSNGQCVEDCSPDCSDKECGDDGCGGSCGSCPSGETCSNNECVCAPITCKSLGVFCGSHDNGCGGTLNCGSCSPGQVCTNGLCVCTPDCSGKECGSDGCGGSCGSCSSGLFCLSNVCVSELLCESDNDCLALGSDCLCANGVCECSVTQDVNGEESVLGNDSFQVGLVDEIPDVDFDSEAENVSISGFEKFVRSSSFSYLFVFLFVVIFFSLYILYKHKTSSSSAVSSSSSSSRVGVSSSNNSMAPSTAGVFQRDNFALLEREGITRDLFENCKSSILSLRSKGFSDEDIINKFVSSGWPREKILLVFRFLN